MTRMTDDHTGSAAPAEHRAELNPNPTIGYPEWRPNPEFCVELARSLRMIASGDCLTGRLTNFNGELRSFGHVVEVAANMFDRMASPAPEKAPGEWRGISTAPHDGSLILVWRRTDWPDDPFAVVRWEHDGFHEHWWIVHDGKSDHQLRGPEPTHWLPLPAPPALPGGEGNQTLTSSRDQPQSDLVKGRSDTQHSAGENLSYGGAIRVCPERDAACPHGPDCPYVVDRYACCPSRPR